MQRMVEGYQSLFRCYGLPSSIQQHKQLLYVIVFLTLFTKYNEKILETGLLFTLNSPVIVSSSLILVMISCFFAGYLAKLTWLFGPVSCNVYQFQANCVAHLIFDPGKLCYSPGNLVQISCVVHLVISSCVGDTWVFVSGKAVLLTWCLVHGGILLTW